MCQWQSKRRKWNSCRRRLTNLKNAIPQITMTKRSRRCRSSRSNGCKRSRKSRQRCTSGTLQQCPISASKRTPSSRHSWTSLITIKNRGNLPNYVLNITSSLKKIWLQRIIQIRWPRQTWSRASLYSLSTREVICLSCRMEWISTRTSRSRKTARGRPSLSSRPGKTSKKWSSTSRSRTSSLT